MDKQKRVNWESGEKELLIEIVTPYNKVVENKNCDTNTNKSKLEAWSQIYKEYNDNSKTQRTLLQIKGEWKRMKIVAKKNVSSYKQNLKQTGGGPPPESINKLDMTLQSLMPMDFIKDANVFDCDNDGSTKKIDINKTVINDLEILEKESPASSTVTLNTGVQICAESLDEFLQTNNFEDLNLKHIMIDHDVLIHDEDFQKNYQSCSMMRPDLEEVDENEYNNYSSTTNNQTRKVQKKKKIKDLTEII
ncbi:hypothetical protein AGLY_017442 [Aphis glycines]|uniref:Regulatory protein zeste n=1 Tax=Aphis glycines TaxID=307491 RepID=A0A6G0SV90_APHGL|nr:hypothetical protein AGLY_017442 [Aphis glycines]